jgi:hypothetical protein
MSANQSSVSEQVRRIRHGILARHGYDADLVAGADQLPPSALEEVSGLMQVSAHWGIASETPVVGRFIVLVKRVMRIALRWYINPIVDQQNRFNQATVRALYELRSENDELRARLERFEATDRNVRQDSP